MDEKEIKALIRAVERLLGNPIQADDQEVDALFVDFGPGKNPAKCVFDLASKAAQRCRLQGSPVPAHVEEALNSTKRILFGEDLETADSRSIIEAVLKPIYGPVQQVSCAFRNRKECTDKDRALLEKLSGEVKKDWSEGSEQ